MRNEHSEALPTIGWICKRHMVHGKWVTVEQKPDCDMDASCKRTEQYLAVNPQATLVAVAAVVSVVAAAAGGNKQQLLPFVCERCNVHGCTESFTCAQCGQ